MKYIIFIPRTQTSGIIRYDKFEEDSLEKAYLTHKANPKSYLVKEVRPVVKELLGEIDNLETNQNK